MPYRFNPFTGNLDLVDTNTAAGSDTQVQYNDGGSLAGSADLTWDDSAKELGVGGDINLDDGGTYETTVQVVTPTANRTISFPDATGTVALVAGSTGQVTYNNAGAQAGLTSANIGSTGEINISLAGAASTPPVSFTGSWYTGGTATTTKPQLLIEPTGTTSTAWSTDGTGLGVNAASGFSGRLLDLQTNGTSRMVVQGDGKLGIGTTSPSTALDVSGELTFSAGSAGWRSAAIKAIDAGGSFAARLAFYTHPSAGAAGAPQERARIDESGRLLVGTSTSIAGATLQVAGTLGGLLEISRFQAGNAGPFISTYKSRGATVGTNTAVVADDLLGGIQFHGAEGSGYQAAANIRAFVESGTISSTSMPGRLVFSTTADGASSPTERMRIDSSGTVLIGKTSSDFTVNGCELSSTGGVFTRTAEAITINRQGSDGIAAVLRRSNVTVGSISVTTSATAYNTSSDYRLKENVVPLTGAADRVNQLQVHRFNFIADPDKTVDGFIAHEAQAVVPECVTGTKDEVDYEGNPVYQGIDQSKLVPLLTAALQEALQKIETLEAKVAALQTI
jgi:hypothetical protein